MHKQSACTTCTTLLQQRLKAGFTNKACFPKRKQLLKKAVQALRLGPYPPKAKALPLRQGPHKHPEPSALLLAAVWAVDITCSLVSTC